MSLCELIPEIWHIIFQALPTRNDLRNVCSVSKAFNALATPLLYRSVVFRESDIIGKNHHKLLGDDDVETKDKTDASVFGLFSLLIDDRNDLLRNFVHEVTLENARDVRYEERVQQMLLPPEDLLTILVKKLPNLENLRFEIEIPITESFLAALLNHKRSPRLHLLGEKGRTQVKVKIPFVRGLHTRVDATATTHEEGYISQTLALHELFSVYPNLEYLSVSVNRLWGGCVVGWFSSTRILPLTLSENETFPPLQSLSLSGYHITEEEVSLWREKFPWHKLRSLRLGHQDSPGFLELATGRVNDLRTFKITSYDVSDSTTTKLDELLSSFHTLESLIVKGSVPSLAAVTHHSSLRHLCLHEIETPGRERQTLDMKEIQYLDQHCPKLLTLEIDINPDGTWPDEFINSIATGFKNLRRLSIHVGLGFAHMTDRSMEPTFASVLTESTAQEFAKRFFDRRGSSSLETISLETGERLRWFPQWPPSYAGEEKKLSERFEIHAPLKSADKPYFIQFHLEKVIADRQRRLW